MSNDDDFISSSRWLLRAIKYVQTYEYKVNAACEKIDVETLLTWLWSIIDFTDNRSSRLYKKILYDHGWQLSES
jgi:hypothetical protein